ncbi:MAG: helix-turn-helix transcriptional regulator [Ruminococcaceae bacterium]|nr:helix-turn-helix transcriptional regulator [Oscillospiraceae bacterium]
MFYNIRVKQLADESGYSLSHFCRIFKEITTYNTNEYINITRCKNAFNLIKDKDYSVTKAAYAVGYDDPAYFTKVFKKLYKISPSKIKKSKQ